MADRSDREHPVVVDPHHHEPDLIHVAEDGEARAFTEPTRRTKQEGADRVVGDLHARRHRLRDQVGNRALAAGRRRSSKQGLEQAWKHDVSVHNRHPTAPVRGEVLDR